MSQPSSFGPTPMLTIKEIAFYLGVHPMTVYRLLKSNAIPGFKIGGRWRIKKEMLDQWIAYNHTQNQPRLTMTQPDIYTHFPK